MSTTAAEAETPTWFVSMAARDPDGLDAAYLEWHALEHQPDIAGLADLRQSLRLVSTPACRAARLASTERFDRVDHVMTYLFGRAGGVAALGALGAELAAAGKMARRLPGVEIGVYGLAGAAASSRVGIGPEAIAARPARGAYLLVEQGSVDPSPLAEVPGVAGVWWFRGVPSAAAHIADTTPLQLACCFLDDDPIAVASAIDGPLRARWAGGDVEALLAAPFHAVVPFERSRFLP